MKKRAVSMILAAAMVCGMMAANVSCVSAKGSDEGKVINIYSWNDEFRQRLEAIYPEVESTSKDGTVTKLKDGTEIHWIVNPNQDGVYQQKLDEALLNQADASADDKVDMFLSETDYVFKYTDKDADVAMPLTDLGIDPDKDLADQYDFTKTTASDADGVQRGATWQCCPGVLVYRRDIAKDVFGTDDPKEVGEKMKDWDTAKETAAQLKEKGYYTFASYADTFRLYGNSIENPWVESGDSVIKVDSKIMDWVKDSKEWLDATGTDNPEHVKDIILAMTGNQDNLLKISKEYSDFTNTKSGMKDAATNADFASDFLGGQNPFEYFAPVAENIKIAPLSAYDQGCVELIQNAFSDYFQGKVDFDKAKANFETAIQERYPEITEIQWPE